MHQSHHQDTIELMSGQVRTMMDHGRDAHGTFPSGNPGLQGQ